MNNAVILDAKAWERITKEAPKLQVLTTAVMCDKFKVNGAIARRSLRELLSKNLIKQVGDHHASFTLYTGAQAKAAAAEAAAAAKK